MQFAGFISSVDGFNIGGENNLKTLWRNNGLPANSLLHTPIYVHFKLQQINIRDVNQVLVPSRSYTYLFYQT
ncbi:hypothetical protein Csa_023554 [Cucumis sativus]|nr:hypothetical protein Csa_023554 [Cucumis sativus]